jgi:hypothetical protein
MAHKKKVGWQNDYSQIIYEITTDKTCISKEKTTTTQQTRKNLFKKRNQLLFDVHNILSRTKIYNLLILIPILPILSYLKKFKIN